MKCSISQYLVIPFFGQQLLHKSCICFCVCVSYLLLFLRLEIWHKKSNIHFAANIATLFYVSSIPVIISLTTFIKTGYSKVNMKEVTTTSILNFYLNFAKTKTHACTNVHAHTYFLYIILWFYAIYIKSSILRLSV